MKQVVLRSGAVIIDEVPQPICRDNEVLVSNAYSAISVGTELSTIMSNKEYSTWNIIKNPNLIKKASKYLKKKGIKGTLETAKEFRKTSKTLGYSTAGLVIAVGRRITDLIVGDRVACAGGKANHAETVSVPRNLVAKIPQMVPYDEAAFTTLGAIAMHGVRRAKIQFGEDIAIFGVGLVGQLAVQIAKAAGCRIIAIDKSTKRVDLAIKMGADSGFIAGKHNLQKEIFSFTSGVGVDAVILCAATPSSIPANQAISMVRKKGKVVVVGSVGMNLERQQLYEKEADFLISRSYGPGRYDPLYEEKGIDYPIDYVRWSENRNMKAFLNLLREKKVNVKPLISLVFPIEKAEEAYQILLSDRSGEKTLGILLKYEVSKSHPETGKAILPIKKVEIAAKVVKGKINVAVIGAGGFAKSVLLPNLSKIPDYHLKSIVSSNGINAKQTALKYNAEYCTTNYKEVLDDRKVNLVFITTPHNLHYQMIVDAAKANKAIYVEKPMCLKEEELVEIEKTVSERKVPLVVGFNRRYAPLTLKAKELLNRKHRPYLINYRVNAGFIAKTRWVQDPEIGGGRIVGECCHFFDLFNYLIKSDVEHIGVEAIPVNDSTVVAHDNVVVTIRWKDGSVSALTYTALGHIDLPKERIEIFAAGSSMIMDDFKEMQLYGFQKRQANIRLKKQDKGHYQELVELAKFLKGEKSNIISFEEGVNAMKMTFTAERLTKEEVM